MIPSSPLLLPSFLLRRPSPLTLSLSLSPSSSLLSSRSIASIDVSSVRARGAGKFSFQSAHGQVGELILMGNFQGFADYVFSFK